MKKLLLILFLIPVIGKTQLPSYPVILRTFFNTYSYQSSDRLMGLNFARKKDGWYVQVINRMTEKVQDEQLFWSLNDASFHTITGMSGELSKEEAEKEVEKYITGQASSNSYYGYQRCRYYGYGTWAMDMIRDYGGGAMSSYSDTLLEGVGRAYSAHSSHFLWYQQGGDQNQDEFMQKKLKPLEKPSTRRIDSVISNINKAVGYFRTLATRNPDYKTVVGNSGMKVFNELMNGYMQMMMAGDEQRAQVFLRSIPVNHSITQIAKNYLASCPPHAILFTFGDNDTYPLWYMQEHEHFRKDVAVLNINLLGFAPYVDLIRRKNIVRFKTGPQYYGDSAFIYFLAKEGDGSVMNAENFLDFLLTKKIPPAEGDASFSGYPTKNISISVDKEKFSHMSGQPGLKNVIPLQLDNYFTSDQFITLDIILTNLYTRPVFFTGKPDLYRDHLQQEGLNFRLLPLSPERAKDNAKISAAITEKILHASIRAVPSNDMHYGIAPDNGMDANLYDIFINLLTLSTSKEHSHMLVSKLLQEYHGKLPYASNLSRLAPLMISAGYVDEGTVVAETYAKQVYDDYLTPRPGAQYINRNFAEFSLQQLKDSLAGLNIKSNMIEDLIKAVQAD